jgi:peptide/nickel transport system substrate-binding protein
MLKSWEHGKGLTLQKNPNYWQRGLPLLNELEFVTVPDNNSQIAQFEGGTLDLIGQPTWSRVASLQQSPQAKVNVYGQGIVSLLSLNLNKPLFKNPHVREAINLAVDRKGIAKAALDGLGEPAGSFLPPVVPDYNQEIKPAPQDTAKAKQLLEEATKEGVDPSFTLLSLAGESLAESASQIVQQNLEEVGFDVKLQPLEAAAMVEKWLAGEADMVLSGWAPAVPDPSELTEFYFSSVAKPNGMDTAPLEALAARANAELNPTKRQAMYYELQEKVAQEKQVVTLVYYPLVFAMKSNYLGLEVNSVSIPWFIGSGFSG